MDPEILCAFLKKGAIISKGKDKALVGWGKRQWAALPLNTVCPQFYFPDFFLKVGMPWVSHAEWLEISLEELESALLQIREEVKEKPQWEQLDSLVFEVAFKELIQKIEEKKLIKAVPYLFEKTTCCMSQTQLLHSLLGAIQHIKKSPSFIYGIWNSNENENEGFLGATPEILFTYSGTELKTTACAGTKEIRDKTPINQKLLLEHAIVVEGISASLKPFGNFSVGQRQKVQFADLMHLITPIEMLLKKPADFKELTQALHPTAALGAFPKDLGMSFLEQLQMRIPRDRFGAPAGVLFKEEAVCLVAIRNVQWGKFGMKIGAGCGVIKDSLLIEELDEVKLKLKTIKNILKL